jgi:hypothetical protein
MDGDKIKDDFERFLTEHPEAVVERYGRRFLISSEISTFCFEYDYPMTYAKEKLRELGFISRASSCSIWDPDAKTHIWVCALDEYSISEDEIVKEARNIIEHEPKITWQNRVWIRKEYLLPLCEKHRISYYRLLGILRKHKLVGRGKSVYDRNLGRFLNAAEVLWSEWERQIVEEAEKRLERRVFEGKFVTRKDLSDIAKDICVDYRDLISLLRKNDDIIGKCMVVFRVKEGINA